MKFENYSYPTRQLLKLIGRVENLKGDVVINFKAAQLDVFVFNSDTFNIKKEDRFRDTRLEKEYLRNFRLTILHYFDNRCGICRRRDNGIEMDHFFIPKSRGGNFLLDCTDGTIFNNTIPLCITCNRSKKDRCFNSLYEIETLRDIILTNEKINLKINRSLLKKAP